MEEPTVKTVARDENRDITFEVLAYRELDEFELQQAIAVFRGTKMGKRLKPNTVYTVTSLIGIYDP